MEYTIKTLGASNRHLTRFEKNRISKLTNITPLRIAKLYYDESLFDVDDKYYLLFSVETVAGATISVTSDGETKYSALQSAIDSVSQQLEKNQVGATVLQILEARNFGQVG